MENSDIVTRFAYHPPLTQEIRELHEGVRSLIWSAADDLNAVLPESREKSLAITHLEEALFWANAAIARNMNE